MTFHNCIHLNIEQLGGGGSKDDVIVDHYWALLDINRRQDIYNFQIICLL